MRALALSSFVLLTSGCGSRGCTRAAPDASVVAEPDAHASDAAAPGAELPAVPPARGAKHVAYGEDGSLVVELPDRLVGYAPNGDKREVAFSPHADVLWPYPSGGSVVVQDGDTLHLFALGPLREVHVAKGRTLDNGLVESDGENDTAVVLLAPGATKVSRFAGPVGKKARAENASLTRSGRFAVVSWDVEGASSNADALVYDVASGRTIGTAMRPRSLGTMPKATFDGDRQIGFRGDRLVVLDLATGRTLRQAAIACPRNAAGEVTRGNPIVDPRGLRVVVTCNEDGLLLDARTLRTLLTRPHIVPGCDNADVLPAHFSDDGSHLVVEGCGGEARLDMTTGRYVCGDGAQLMGAPYEPQGPQAPPPRSVGVPPCHDGGAFGMGGSDVSLSRHYRAESNASGAELVGPGNLRLPLPTTGAIAGEVAVSPKEDRCAYVDEGGKVIVRALPSGALLSELKL